MKRGEAESMARVCGDVLDQMARGEQAMLERTTDREYGPYYKVVGPGWVASGRGRFTFERSLVGILLRDGKE